MDSDRGYRAPSVSYAGISLRSANISYYFCRLLCYLKDFLPRLVQLIHTSLDLIHLENIYNSLVCKFTNKGVTTVAIACCLLYSPLGLAKDTTPSTISGQQSQQTSNSDATASSGTPSFVVDRGLQAYRDGDYISAISLFEQAVSNTTTQEQIGEQINALFYLSDSYRALGLRQKQLNILSKVNVLREKIEEPARLVGLNSRLAGLYLNARAYLNAKTLLDAARELARSAGRNDLLATLWNDYGNYHVALGENSAAARAFERSMLLAKSEKNWLLASRAGLNLARVMIDSDRIIDANRLYGFINDGITNTRRLSSRYNQAENYLTIGDLLRTAQIKYRRPASWRREAYNILQEAYVIAEELKKPRVASYALGYMSMLYEDEARYAEALRYAQRAIFTAQLADAHESLYRWEWASARILRSQGNIEEAIVAYRAAMSTLQKIRSDLISRGGRSFRQLVGPIYFELADLLLTRTATLEDKDSIQQNLLEVRNTLEQNKVAEIEDYFQHECVLPPEQTTKLDQVAQDSAVIYPVLLNNRTELLVSFPTGLQQFTTEVGMKRLSEEVLRFRNSIDRLQDDIIYQQYGRNLYNWLIAPIESELKRQNITTLVFIPDGPLRSIPISALYDGKQYLVEKYAIATTIGLDLTNPHPIAREQVQVLLNGLTKPVQGQSALPYVDNELANIRALYTSNSKVLKDERFLLRVAEKEMSQGLYSIVHIASHGHFDKDHKKSYVLTYDDKLTMDRLEQTVGLRRFQEEPLELLVLSACETAAGDERAALGLAGIALKAGARSALATLWLVNDEATADLVSEFYKQIKIDKEISKAKALQKAQITMIEKKGYEHPNLWAPFLLLGNWL